MKNLISATVLASTLTTAATASEHISKSISYEIEYPPKDAMYLYTAEGEKYWLDKWNPTIYSGNGYNSNDVFIDSGYDGNTYIYTVIDFDTDNFEIRYSENIIGMTAGTLNIQFHPVEKTKTKVTLTYSLTSISKSGTDFVKEIDTHFEEAMLSWKEAIESNKTEIEGFLKSIN